MAILVDSGTADMADEVLDAVRAISEPHKQHCGAILPDDPGREIAWAPPAPDGWHMKVESEQVTNRRMGKLP